MIDLVRIEVENFRPFFGRHDIDIGYSDKKLVIFEGNTGEGKTSLTEAIKWCLFGIGLSEKEGVEDFNIFNKEALVKTSIKEPITCRVTLTFEIKDNKKNSEKIVFSRSMQLMKKRELFITQTGVYHPRKDEFEFVKNGGEYQVFKALKWEGSQQIELESGPHNIRETYFPTIVNDYYIVFGERFVDPHNSEKIRIAIERNCYANVFDRVKNNLENVRNNLRKEMTNDKRKRERLEVLIEEKSDRQIVIDEKRKKLDISKQNLVRLRDGISFKDKEIGLAGSQQAKILKEEREFQEIEVKRLGKEIKDIEKKLKGDGFVVLNRVLSLSSENSLLKELEKLVKKGEIPPDIKIEFINSLIEAGKCICGTSLTSFMDRKLQKLRDEYVLGENYKEFLDLKFELKGNLDKLKYLVENYYKELNYVENIKEKKFSLDIRLEKISEELESLRDIEKLEKERTKLVEFRNNIETEIVILSDEIGDLEREQKITQREIEKTGTVDKNEEYHILDKFIEDVKNQMDVVKMNTIDSTRKDIEIFASELYKKLFKHVSEIVRVELDTKYNVRVVIKKHNKEYVKTDFSTGEGLVFAISFLTALRKYSGYSGPIFLDSPFSVLDPDHRTNVSLNLPQNIPGQLIIFTRLDTFETLKDELKRFINKIIVIDKEKEWHSKMTVTRG